VYAIYAPAASSFRRPRIERLLTSNELHRIGAITERWTVAQRWTLLLTRLLRRWLGGKWLPGLPEDAALLLSG
jgi:hypothetical protein